MPVKDCESHCPKCNAGIDSIDYDASEFKDRYITQDAECKECGYVFTEVSEVHYLFTEFD